MTRSPSPAVAEAPRAWPSLIGALVLLWGYWPTLLSMQKVWATDPRYSHGFLIQLFSFFLLWTRRGKIIQPWSAPSPWGLAPIALGAAMHFGGSATNQDWIEAASLIPSLAGLCVLTWGWDALRPCLAPIAFLAFMIPLPYRVELGLGGPLQDLATRSSAFVLQVFGLPALRQGNTITLGHTKIGVVEACNGLSMLTFFFAISVGLTLVSHRAWIERTLIVAGAIPIALVANVARITATGLLVEGVGHGVAGVDFHDLAGYLMMPLGLGLLQAEGVLIARLFPEAPPVSPGSTRPMPGPGTEDDFPGSADVQGESERPSRWFETPGASRAGSQGLR